MNTRLPFLLTSKKVLVVVVVQMGLVDDENEQPVPASSLSAF